MRKDELIEALFSIDPAELEYEEWLNVGMALKEEGIDLGYWEEWSRGDLSRFHEGECARKWDGFHGNPNPIKAGTIYMLARKQGWRPHESCNDDGGRELDWDDYITDDDVKIVSPEWVEGKELHEPTDVDWDPAAEIIAYLETLFEPDEKVGYVVEVWNNDGRFMPTKGHWDRTAEQLIAELRKCKGDITNVFGSYNRDAGAWIRFNPLDGQGCKNDNVTDYRYALVESDNTDIEKQNEILRALELPIACLVHSGKKSLHAIVRVDAANYDEYRRRVDFLYTVCEKNGLSVDKQNKNPSRLSRMPGIVRQDHKQYLIDVNIGKHNYAEWREWIETVNDDLPDPESLADTWNDLPPLSPPLINGILRQGHKMLLAGPSKAGKSFALIQLAIAIAEGREWFGFQCAQGRILYVNLELDRASCLHRFKDVYTTLGIEPSHIGNIDVWNLRGKSTPMDKLAPKLIRRAAKKDYIAVVIDPIYKVITGDENAADQMAHFCNQFDKICIELDSAVIYCHHHSKGYQGTKRSMDRASGSGVFARDPDALIDMIELDVTIPQGTEKAYQSAWRLEGTLREFPAFDPVNIFFSHPIHLMDNNELLIYARPKGEGLTQKERSEKAATARTEQKNKRFQSLLNGFEAYKDENGKAEIKDLAMYLDVTERTVRRYIKEMKEQGDFNLTLKNGLVSMSDNVNNE